MFVRIELATCSMLCTLSSSLCVIMYRIWNLELDIRVVSHKKLSDVRIAVDVSDFSLTVFVRFNVLADSELPNMIAGKQIRVQI